MEQDDAQLINELASGNPNAMNTLFERYQRPVLNFALRILNNRADAEDVTSEVFMAVINRRYLVKQGAKFSTWLFTVCRNACLDRVRRRKKLVSFWFTKNTDGDVQEWDVADPQDLAHQELIRQESTLKVQRAITKLPIDQKEALLLREYQDLSYAEIAEILSCSLDNVKILIYRARENLRTQLAPGTREEQI